MGGPKQPSTTTQIQKVELPKWVENASEENYKLAGEVADIPYKSYSGPRVAGLTDMERAAGGTLSAGMDASNAAFGGAAGIAGAMGGYRPQMIRDPGAVGDVTAQSFLSRDVGAYMNPELQSVIDPTMASMRREIEMGRQGNSDAARGVGAWGGSRHGVTDAVMASEGARNMAATEAGMRSNAFNNASSLMMADNASALQAALANQNNAQTNAGRSVAVQGQNQQAGLAGAGLNLQAGSLLSQIGQQQSDTAGRNAMLQSTLGGQERAVNQAQMDVDYENWFNKTNEPVNDLNIRMAALGMSPYGKTSTTTTTQPNQNSSNGLMTGLGVMSTVLPLMFSDRKVKKNVKKVGKVGNTDLNAYEFQYKKGFMGRSGPKQIGLMADDVKKKVPEAVHPVTVKGKKVDAVDYGTALGKAPRDKRDDKGKIRGSYKPRRIGVGGHARAA